MTEEQLSVFRKMLEQKREALMETKTVSDDAAKPVELDQSSVGRLSRMDAMQNQAMALENQRRKKLELRAIEKALLRMAQGDYGFYELCDEEIDPRRLQYNPAAAACIRCAEQREQQ